MPENLTSAEPSDALPTRVADRRGFFWALGRVVAGSSLAVGLVALAASQLLWFLGLARFMFTNVVIASPHKFKAGRPDDLTQGQVETKFTAQFGVWIVRHEYQGKPQIFALKTVCTHLCCTPNWL